MKYPVLTERRFPGGERRENSSYSIMPLSNILSVQGTMFFFCTCQIHYPPRLHPLCCRRLKIEFTEHKLLLLAWAISFCHLGQIIQWTHNITWKWHLYTIKKHGTPPHEMSMNIVGNYFTHDALHKRYVYWPFCLPFCHESISCFCYYASDNCYLLYVDSTFFYEPFESVGKKHCWDGTVIIQ